MAAYDGVEEFDDYDEEEDGIDERYYADAMQQDGIDENPTRRKRRAHRRRRRSLHRYPHKTHQRRVTEHSFAD